MMSSPARKPLTFGDLIKKDLQDAYHFPYFPSSYQPTYCKFRNDINGPYRVFDNPPDSKTQDEKLYPCRNLCVTGNEVPVLLDYQPPSFLKEHWKTWLPDFPDVDIRPVSQGLQDDKPIVTNTAIQSLPKSRHVVDPDVLYKVQLKSSIPDVGAPCPKHFPSEDAVSFPCMVKVDMSLAGCGNRVAHDRNELTAVIKEIRNTGWTGNLVFQEYIEDVNNTYSFQFYLHASEEMHWMGTTVGGFNGFSWTSATVDWNQDKQEEYKNLFHDQFAVPVKDYLHNQGYFGIVNCEVMVCDHGMYLVDMNPRLSGDTTYIIIADYMAQFGFLHSFMKPKLKINKSAKALVERANRINTGTRSGRIVIIGAADVEEDKSEFEVSVFARSTTEAEELYNRIYHREPNLDKNKK